MTLVLVSSIAENGMQHEVIAGEHKFISDVDQELGGNATGPDPHQLLLAALGSCTSMTLKLFAQRRDWKLEAVKITLNEESIDDPGNPGRKMSKITRDIEVKGEFTKEQLDALRSIADKCPIHKLLTGAKQILTNLESIN